MAALKIRPIQPDDVQDVVRIVKETITTGDTYAFDPASTEADIERFWIAAPLETYVAVSDGKRVGTYYIKPNQPGLGDHVCNCGFITSASARGLGVGRQMAEHALEQAKRLGFSAMQFNYVVESNQGAIRLWRDLGFEIIGRIPRAFRHRELGLQDALIMHRFL